MSSLLLLLAFFRLLTFLTLAALLVARCSKIFLLEQLLLKLGGGGVWREALRDPLFLLLFLNHFFYSDFVVIEIKLLTPQNILILKDCY